MSALPFILVGGAYLLGSIPTGLWLGKAWKGIDVRTQGSGNLGATNVFRVLGPTPGLLTLVIDIAKGFLSVFAAQRLYPGHLNLAVLTGLAAILGHTFSVFVRFRGGKGVATSAGVFLALLPIPSIAALASFVLVFAVTRIVSAGSITGALTLVVSAFGTQAPNILCWTATAVALFVIWTHRGNIQRLLDGTENKIEWKNKST